MSTTSKDGGGASSGTQPSVITVPVNISLKGWIQGWIQAVEIFLSSAKDSVQRAEITKSPLS